MDTINNFFRAAAVPTAFILFFVWMENQDRWTLFLRATSGKYHVIAGSAT